MTLHFAIRAIHSENVPKSSGENKLKLLTLKIKSDIQT